MMLTESVKKTFLTLVRLGLGHPAALDSETVQGISLPETIDWDAVLTLASEHGLAAIASDGAQVLSGQGALSGKRAMAPELKMRWIATVLRSYEQTYGDYRMRIAQLASLYQKHGFRMMVLKGYGLSLNYPVPAHRPCGDIDIWLFGRYKEADAALSQELSIPIDNAHHHHTIFQFRGYTVENHYDLVDTHYGHGNTELEKIFKSLTEKDLSSTEINGQTIWLPSPDFNALFLLRHMMQHFASTRMNIRQLLDWGLFVKRHSSDIDWPWLQDILHRFRMDGFFNCMMAICVEDLGFDPASFPACQADAAMKERILDDILSPEFSGQTPDRFLARIAFKYRRWQANAWKQDFCYGDNRFWSFLVSAWSHLIKPSMI